MVLSPLAPARLLCAVLATLLPYATPGPLGERCVLAQQAGQTGRRAGPVQVVIDSTPPGATVYVDGRPQGAAGPSFGLRLERGEHRVTLELDGYARVEETINVSGRQRFSFSLKPAAGRLEVRAPGTNRTALGAEVLIDGNVAGSVPALMEVRPGPHTIEVRKPGFRALRETLDVRGGETVTKWVSLQPQGGAAVLYVNADLKSAEVFVDGQPRGPAPAKIDGLSEGDHRVEVRRADGVQGTQPWLQMVRVSAGRPTQVTARLRGAPARAAETPAAPKRADPAQAAASNQHAEGKLRVVMLNPVDGAKYYIDGRAYDEAAILSERGVDLEVGSKVVVVQKEGFGQQRREVSVRAGVTEVVRIDLRDRGQITVYSEPRGARVFVNKGQVGVSPKVIEDLEAGTYLIDVQQPGFEPYFEQVVVRGGEKSTVNATLVPKAGPGPDKAAMIRGLTSFSAVTIPSGSFTMDAGTGYPYFLNLRLTVGIAGGKGRGFGIDAGAELRSTFYETDVGANVRAQLVKAGPIALGASFYIGGGGGPRKRNSFNLEVGVPVTLLAGNLVKLTVRPFLQYYSDRLCPSQQDMQELVDHNDTATILNLIQPEHVGDRCASTIDKTVTPEIPARYTYNAVAAAAGFDPITRERSAAVVPYNPDYVLTRDGRSVLVFQEAGTPVLDRFNGVRWMLQAAVEIAVTPNASLWGLIEGAPFQGSRQAYTDKFNRVFPIDDFPLYGRVGFTTKF